MKPKRLSKIYELIEVIFDPSRLPEGTREQLDIQGLIYNLGKDKVFSEYMKRLMIFYLEMETR